MTVFYSNDENKMTRVECSEVDFKRDGTIVLDEGTDNETEINYESIIRIEE